MNHYTRDCRANADERQVRSSTRRASERRASCASAATLSLSQPSTSNTTQRYTQPQLTPNPMCSTAHVSHPYAGANCYHAPSWRASHPPPSSQPLLPSSLFPLSQLTSSPPPHVEDLKGISPPVTQHVHIPSVSSRQVLSSPVHSVNQLGSAADGSLSDHGLQDGSVLHKLRSSSAVLGRLVHQQPSQDAASPTAGLRIVLCALQESVAKLLSLEKTHQACLTSMADALGLSTLHTQHQQHSTPQCTDLRGSRRRGRSSLSRVESTSTSPSSSPARRLLRLK